MTACTICGHPAPWIDLSTSKPVCAKHHRPYRTMARPPSLDSDAWDRLRATEVWMAGSAYERDQATAKRLAGVVR
jgi:hypothetical protein